MGKKDTKSETLDNSTMESTSSESTTKLETIVAPEEPTMVGLDPAKSTDKFATESPKPKPAPKFNGPTVTFKNIQLKDGIVGVTCLDTKCPLSQIQMIAIKAGDATYVYRRI